MRVSNGDIVPYESYMAPLVHMIAFAVIIICCILLLNRLLPGGPLRQRRRCEKEEQSVGQWMTGLLVFIVLNLWGNAIASTVVGLSAVCIAWVLHWQRAGLASPTNGGHGNFTN